MKNIITFVSNDKNKPIMACSVCINKMTSDFWELLKKDAIGSIRRLAPKTDAIVIVWDKKKIFKFKHATYDKVKCQI